MKTIEDVCVMCPLGCHLTIEETKKGEYKVSGNTCPRGEAYAKNEQTDPKRSVSTLIKLSGGGVVQVKTSEPIKKSLIFKVLEELSSVELKRKPKIGTIIVKNILNSGADIVAIGL